VESEGIVYGAKEMSCLIPYDQFQTPARASPFVPSYMSTTIPWGLAIHPNRRVKIRSLT
jgi:hypothetical protein